MSTNTTDQDKRTGAPITNTKLSAQIDDLESRHDQLVAKMDEMNPSGPNGKLRQLRRKGELNKREIGKLREQYQQLAIELADVKESIRRKNQLENIVLELQGKVAELEEDQ